MHRKQRNKSPRTAREEETATTRATAGGDDRAFARQSYLRKGGGWTGAGTGTGTGECGSAAPVPTDWRVGVVMAICLPLSLLIFWKVTLPALAWALGSVVGAETLQNLGFFGKDMFSLATAECPLWLSSKERAFLDDRSPVDVLRVTDVSPEDFEAIAKRGEPVVITDALRDWEAFGLYDCGYFMRRYPKATYFDWQGQEYISLGNITRRPGFTGLKCASGYIETDTETNQKYTKEWLSKMPKPYFLREYADEGSLFEGTSVTGFIGVPGTGVSPHLDETCDTIMTAQLSGVKNWSMSWPVKEGNTIRWSKPIMFTLHPGEAMVWYLAMRHHTEVLDGCSLSFSFLLNRPAPGDYLRRLVRDLDSVPRTRRDDLFGETQAARLDYIDSCSVSSDSGEITNT